MTRYIAISLAVLTSLSTLAERPELISNNVKYSDTGIKSASGRDAGISVEARALLGRDGATDLEVTATGALSRVQVKAGLELEDPLTRNYAASGAFTSIRLDGLALHSREQIQVQASATSFDGTRAGVVTLTETVKRRPDLRVSNLSVPPNAIAGNPTNFYLVVSEWNGDIGARADCVLRVDGVEVDRARNIWIDRGDTVTCSMVHAFTNPGPSQVTFAIENVSPADWDPSNNTFGPLPVSVRDASQVVPGGSYHVTTTARTYDDEYMEQGDESQPDWQSFHVHNVEKTNITRLDATMPVPLDFETMRVTFSEDSDGENLRFFTSDEWLWVGNWPQANCAELAWGRSYSMYGCVNNGVTTFHYWRGNTVALYYSHQWGQFTNNWTGEVHTYDFEMAMDDTFGGPKQYGSTVSMQLIASDANHAWQIDPFVTLQSWAYPESTTSGCYTSWSGPVCWWRKLNTSGKDGMDTEAND